MILNKKNGKKYFNLNDFHFQYKLYLTNTY